MFAVDVVVVGSMAICILFAHYLSTYYTYLDLPRYLSIT